MAVLAGIAFGYAHAAVVIEGSNYPTVSGRAGIQLRYPVKGAGGSTYLQYYPSPRLGAYIGLWGNSNDTDDHGIHVHACGSNVYGSIGVVDNYCTHFSASTRPFDQQSPSFTSIVMNDVTTFQSWQVGQDLLLKGKDTATLYSYGGTPYNRISSVTLNGEDGTQLRVATNLISDESLAGVPVLHIPSYA